jgi:hypothetical protein
MMVPGEHDNPLDTLTPQQCNGMAARVTWLVCHANQAQCPIVSCDEHCGPAVGREPIQTSMDFGGTEPAIFEQSMIPYQCLPSVHFGFGTEARKRTTRGTR